MKEVALNVKMHCPSCVLVLMDLEEVVGIEEVTANYKKNLLELRFEEKVIDETEIRLQISKLGYEVV